VDEHGLAEQHYDRERAQEWIWKEAKDSALSRRRFLELLAGRLSGRANGSWDANGGLHPPSPNDFGTDQDVKPAPSEFFIKNGSDLEMRWEAMAGRGYVVPNELFFVRNNSPRAPRIDPSTWRLEVHGSGVSRARSFSFDDILTMPSKKVIRALECAGNGRNFFQVSHGKKIEGTPWNLGAIGVAEWTGVPLREVLERAGVKDSARDVMPEGLDEARVKRPIPLSKAIMDDTLLVYAMNGVSLPPDHGFPVRVLVPGWVGIAHIKWVGRIEVSEESLYSPYNTLKYVFIGSEYDPAPPSLGPPLTTQKVKSAFELPWDGEIPTGHRLLTGRSWSGEGRIAKVEVSTDGGASWRAARLREPNIDLAWVQWELEWNAAPGSYQLQARATDSQGNVQPDRIPMNEEGYAHWAVVTHPLRVCD
jgi:DMSO/TMAO reductase YedYZ molybdopterin-dependent catalytic subunit